MGVALGSILIPFKNDFLQSLLRISSKKVLIDFQRSYEIIIPQNHKLMSGREKMKPSNKSQDLLLNQITSKVTRSNVMKCLYITISLTFAVLLITACTVNYSPVSGVIPTETENPTPSATIVPTATEDPFMDFAGKDCTNWEKPCPAKFGDWKSGHPLGEEHVRRRSP